MTQPISSSTQEQLLDFAERAFGENGFHGTSLRAVMRDAGVNPASAHYHFGSKRALYEAVVGRRMTEINADRLLRLEHLGARKMAPKKRLPALIHAYIAPHLELAVTPGGLSYSKLLSRLDVEPKELTQGFYETHTQVRDQYFDALHDCVPQLERATLGRLWSFALGLMTMCPIDRGFESLTGIDPAAGPPDEMAWQIADFCAAGIHELGKRETSRL